MQRAGQKIPEHTSQFDLKLLLCPQYRHAGGSAGMALPRSLSSKVWQQVAANCSESKSRSVQHTQAQALRSQELVADKLVSFAA